MAEAVDAAGFAALGLHVGQLFLNTRGGTSVPKALAVLAASRNALAEPLAVATKRRGKTFEHRVKAMPEIPVPVVKRRYTLLYSWA